LLNKPALKELMDKVDSKYTLVIVAAKQARNAITKNPDTFSANMVNPVTQALYDIRDDKINWASDNTAAPYGVNDGMSYVTPLNIDGSEEENT
jgi:DNA-directed RNA polymerase subunit omega